MENSEFQQEKEAPFEGYQNKRNQTMGTASVILSVIALITPYFVYTTLILGPLAIILGLLSKGGEPTMETSGKIGVILGTISLVLLALILYASFSYLISQAGGWENFYNTYSDPSPLYPNTF